jgi:hypothetical protein
MPGSDAEYFKTPKSISFHKLPGMVIHHEITVDTLLVREEMMCDKDDPDMEEICDFCDEEPTTCGKCVEECLTEAEEAHFEAQRDSRD